MVIINQSAPNIKIWLRRSNLLKPCFVFLYCGHNSGIHPQVIKQLLATSNRKLNYQKELINSRF